MLNLYPLKISKKVKRVYMYNEDVNPYRFAKNMTRVNNIYFMRSSDLIWGEFLDIDVVLKPHSIDKFIEEEEIIKDNDELFIKTFYKHIRKIFMENGFYYKKMNKYISKKDSFPMKTNGSISRHVSYKIKIYKIQDIFYLAIEPGYSFLSTDYSIKSDAQSAYVYNIKSGKSFEFAGIKNKKLRIKVSNNKIVTVRYPENYYFNYSSSEAKEKGFSKEKRWIYQKNLGKVWENLSKKLKFLNNILDLKKPYNLKNENYLRLNPKYNFQEGESTSVKDIFKYSFKNLETEDIELIFFFHSMKQLQENYNNLGKVLGSKKSPFFSYLDSLGINHVGFLKNPRYDKSFFEYDKENLTIDPNDKEFLLNLDDNKKYIGIIVLDEYIGDIEPLIENFPKNIIMQPILKDNIKLKDLYILKSFAYKIAEFTRGAVPFELEELKKYKDDLFVGVDLSHEYYKKKSHLVVSGVDSSGKVIYIKKEKNIKLNEKIEIEKLKSQMVKVINKFKDINGDFPETLYLYRDGLFIEDLEILKEYFKTSDINLVIIEIDKRSLINSPRDLKGKFLNLDNDIYVYYNHNYLNQRGVEVQIKLNNSLHSDDEVVKQAYLLTKMHYGSPYTSTKLPYPIFVTDKVGRTDYEWRLTIPYLK